MDKEWWTKYYERNRQRRIEYSRRWYREHKERARANNTNWNRRHAGTEKYLAARRITNQARRARLRGALGKFTQDELKTKFAYFGNRCVYCLKPDKLTIDHKIPLSRGGSNQLANIVPACRFCNNSKNSKTAKEFIAIR